jgi:hypothetical protein
MMLIRANTLAFGLIGKDGPHGIIKICFGNMNLIFGSEVEILVFWEYMFRILFRVYLAGEAAKEPEKDGCAHRSRNKFYCTVGGEYLTKIFHKENSRWWVSHPPTFPVVSRSNIHPTTLRL